MYLEIMSNEAYGRLCTSHSDGSELYLQRSHHSDPLPVSTVQLAFTYSGNTLYCETSVLEMFRIQNREFGSL